MEAIVRLVIAGSIFLAMVGWESISPRRTHSMARLRRWPVNLGLALFNMLFMRVTMGGLAYASAVWAEHSAFGLLNLWPTPLWLKALITFVVLDFAIYGQHILMHKIPMLWRLHRVHHSDIEFDATTAVRFHPIEIVLSMFYKTLCIVLMGGLPLAVVVFEIALNGAATFNHSNIKLPEKLESLLRFVIITPDLHRIHHSTKPAETDSNYGFSVSWWDRLCGTYCPQAEHPQTSMTIGLNAFRKPEELTFTQCLLMPFSAKATECHESGNGFRCPDFLQGTATRSGEDATDAAFKSRGSCAASYQTCRAHDTDGNKNDGVCCGIMVRADDRSPFLRVFGANVPHQNFSTAWRRSRRADARGAV